MATQIVVRLISAAEAAVILTLFLLALFAIGFVFARIVRIDAPRSASVGIAGGLALTAAVTWYAYIAHDTTRFILPALIWVGAGLLVALLVAALLQGGTVRQALARWQAPNLGAIFPMTFFASLFYNFTSPSGRMEVVMLGNGDPFSWAMTADKSRSMLSEIHGTSPGYWQGLLIDGSGTYDTLALLAQLRGLTAVETLPYFIIALAALIGLATYELLVRIYKVDWRAAFPMALAVVTAPFYFYIFLNGFFAQMLATFAALAALLVVLPAPDEEVGPKPLRQQIGRGLSLAPAMALLIISYQSGFAPFLILIVFASAAAFMFRNTQGVKGLAPTITAGAIVPIAIALVAACVALPLTANHLIKQTIFASSVTAGWPVALIDPRYLLGIPTFSGFSLLNGKALTPYFYIPFFAACGLLLMSFRKPGRDAGVRNMAAALVTFAVFVLIYLLGYAIRGNTYQTWKFAAFTVLPLTFAPLAALYHALALRRATQPVSRGPVFVSAALAGVCALSLLSWSKDTRAASFTPLLEELRALSGQAAASSGVVLQTGPHIETFLAMNAIRVPGPVIPLSETYIPATPATDAILDQPGLSTIRKAGCATLEREIDALQRPHEESDPENKYIIDMNWRASLGYLSFGGACGAGSRTVTSIEGLSGAEPWGRWSDGPAVELKLPSFGRRTLALKFRIRPFAVEGKPQRMFVTVNGQDAGSVSVADAGVLTVPVPKAWNQGDEIVVQFSFPDRRAPRDFDPKTTDTRELAIGFVDLSVKTIDAAAERDAAPAKANFQVYPS